MKTIKGILTGTVIVFAMGTSCIAQTSNQEQSTNEGMQQGTQQGMHEEMMKEECMMTLMNGKMMQMKMVPMEQNMTLKNGDMVMTDGTVMKKDGKQMTLKEGECVNMSGKVKESKMMKDDKMKSQK